MHPADLPDPAADTLRRAVDRHREGDLDTARASYLRVLESQPQQVDALNLLGVIEHQRGNPAAAIAWLARALAIDDSRPDVHANLGAALRALGRSREALSSLNRALQLAPTHVVALNNRAAVQLDMRCPHAALADVERSLAIDARQPAALFNRASALHELGRDAAALAACDEALATLPASEELHNLRGKLLRRLGHAGTALASFEAGLRLQPAHAGLLVNRGHALADLGRHAEAADSYQRALELAPDMPWLPGHCLHARLKICDWHGVDELVRRIRDGIATGQPVCEPFVALLTPLDAAQQRRCAEIHARTRWPDAIAAPFADDASGAPRRLRIGYFSADFHEHPTARLLAGVIEEHDRGRVETFAFSFGPSHEDAMRHRLQGAFDHFIDVSGLDDAAVVALARAHAIDIAVDLAGSTQASRGGIFARRAAPLQAGWLGFPGSSGAPFMDYLVADATVVPDADANAFSEAIARLPHAYQPNDRRRAIAPGCPPRTALGLPEDGFVFCCFNNLSKITPEVFELWMGLLRQVPGSVLWLLEGQDVAARHLRTAARLRGVDGRRLVFAPRLPPAEHLARHRAADLFLDTWPYNAHTTASDALWAGLPLLTRRGETFAGRVAASLLHASGLPELVTPSAEDYVRTALQLAREPARLAALRRRLVEHGGRSPLFDTPRFARDLESLYLQMWNRRRNGLAPAALHVTRPAR